MPGTLIEKAKPPPTQEFYRLLHQLLQFPTRHHHLKWLRNRGQTPISAIKTPHRPTTPNSEMRSPAHISCAPRSQLITQGHAVADPSIHRSSHSQRRCMHSGQLPSPRNSVQQIQQGHHMCMRNFSHRRWTFLILFLRQRRRNHCQT